MPRPEEDFLVEKRNNVTVVRFLQPDLLSIPDVGRMESRLRELVAQGANRLVFDLSNVRYAGSAMLAMMLGVRLALSSDGQLILSNTTGISQLLRLSKTNRLFTEAPSVDQACALLK